MGKVYSSFYSDSNYENFTMYVCLYVQEDIVACFGTTENGKVNGMPLWCLVFGIFDSKIYLCFLKYIFSYDIRGPDIGISLPWSDYISEDVMSRD